MFLVFVVVFARAKAGFCNVVSMGFSSSVSMRLNTELLGVLRGQSLPARDLHRLGACNPSDWLVREQPVQNVEADMPARGAPRDVAAIDVMPQRQPRAAAERVQFPPEIEAAPVRLEATR